MVFFTFYSFIIKFFSFMITLIVTCISPIFVSPFPFALTKIVYKTIVSKL